MKPKLETSYRNLAESSEAAEAVVDVETTLEHEDDLNELAELYRVNPPIPTEGAVSLDTSQVVILNNDIAILETDIAKIAVDTDLDVPQSAPTTVEEDISDETSDESLSNRDPVKQRPRMTAKELRERYDGKYRRYVARSAWEERGQQYKEIAKNREKFSIEAEQLEVANVYNYGRPSLKRFDERLVSERVKTENSLNYFNDQIGYIQTNIASRNLLQKMIAFGQRHVSFLGSDEERLKIAKLETEKQEMLKQAEKLISDIEQSKSQEQSYQETSARSSHAQYARGRAINEATFASNRKKLLGSVREKNQKSRLASEITAELLAEGKLDVSKLAKETNSLVVHTIPLNGWPISNTEMNNTEIRVEEITTEEKINIVTEKQPDISVSIVAIDNPDFKHRTMYPFGLIIDGTMIASYPNDSSTITEGDKRYRKGVSQGDGKGTTLQIDPVGEFVNNAKKDTAPSHEYNEAIVHKPNIKGIFIDGERLKPVTDIETGKTHDYYKDKVEVYYLPGQEAQIFRQYKDVIDLPYDVIDEKDLPQKKVIAKSGPYAGQEVFRFTRIRSGEQKAIEFAESNYPNLPIYIRRADGVYDINGQAVTAEDVYGTDS